MPKKNIDANSSSLGPPAFLPTLSPPQDIPATATSKRELFAYIIGVLLLPVLVLWRQDDVLFTRVGYIDPWFYVGYAKNLVEFKRYLFQAHYTGSRLAWILPCYAVHSLFSPVPAAWILHLGVWTIGALSFFLTLRWIAGARAAFLTTVLLGTHTWFWFAVGWDYPDGAAMACVLLMTALYTYAALRPARPIPLVLAGIAGAAALHCTLGWAGLAPLFPLPYIGLAYAWHQRPPLRSLRDAVLWSGLGGIGLTAVLAAVNYRLDGNLWFFVPSIQQGKSLAGQPIHWLAGVWGAKGLSIFLWFGTAGALISLVLLPARLRTRPWTRTLPALVFSSQCLLTLAYLSYFQRTEAHGLSYIYYASYLMPSTFFVIGTTFWQGVDRLSRRMWLCVCGLALVVPGLLWYDYDGDYAGQWRATALAALLAGLLLLAALYLRRPAITCLLAIAGFGCLSVGSRSFQEADPHIARRNYENILNARSRVDYLRRGRAIHFWFDDKDPEYYSYLAWTSTYISAFSYLHGRFPQLPCDPSALPGLLLVVLSSLPDASQLATRNLNDCARSSGLVAHIQSTQTVRRVNRPYTVTMLEAAPDPTVWHPMKVASDAAGNRVLAPADPSVEGPVLSLDGWQAWPGTVVKLSSEGLDLRTPPDLNGIAAAYPEFLVSEPGRYRFLFRYRLDRGELLLGLRRQGSWDWAGGFPSFAPADVTCFTADLRRGDVFQLQIVNYNAAGHAALSLVLREVTILRSDLPH